MDDHPKTKHSRIKEINTPSQKQYNQNSAITFGTYYIDKDNGFGYEVVKKEIIKREFGFKTAQEARKKGFEASKKIIHDLED